MTTINRFSGTNGTHAMDLTPSQPPAPIASHGLTLTAESVKRTMESLLKIREFVLSNLEPGTDIIEMPGVDRKILAQPGSEKIGYLLSGWYQHDTREHELGDGHLEVVITSRLISHSAGSILGEGIGSCSTHEVKYRYRNGKRTCPACGSEQLNKSKDRPEWYCWAKKGGCGTVFGLDDPRIVGQVVGRVDNPDIADVRNTVRKMAAKRADIDCAKRTCCLSGFVTQDLDEMPHGADDQADAGERRPPAPAPAPDRAPRGQREPQGESYVQRAGEPPLSPGRVLWNAAGVVKKRNPDAFHALTAWGKDRGFPARMIDWNAEQARAGEEELLRLDQAGGESAPSGVQAGYPRRPQAPVQPAPVAADDMPGFKLKAELIDLSNKSGHTTLMGEVAVWGKGRGFPTRMVEWSPDQVSMARAYAKDTLRDLSEEGGA